MDARMSSSARHSWMGFLFFMDALTTPVLRFLRAMSSLLWGEMSTALGTEIPPNWSLVTSSRGAAFSRPEGEGHGLVRLHLLSGVLLGPHDVVDEPLDDAQLGLSEPPVGVLASGVGDVGGREVHVLGKSAVVDDDVGCVVLAEDQGLLCYDLVCHLNHLTGLSVLPLTIWSRETLLTLMTL